MRRIDPYPVPLELSEDVEKRLLQMPWTLHRMHARSLEPGSEDELLLEADLHPAGAFPGRHSVRREQKMKVSVRYREREQAERRSHARQRSRRPTAGRNTRSDRAVVGESHRDVVPHRVVDLSIDRPRRESSALPLAIEFVLHVPQRSRRRDQPKVA